MYDVIVVGSGIGGSHLASKLSCKTLVLEKEKTIKPKDSGIVSKHFFDFFGKEFIKNEIFEMKIIAPSGAIINLHRSSEPMAYILKREHFASHLRKMARKHADIKTEIVQEILYEDGFVRVTTNNGEYETKLVVGADGGNSLVRRSAGIESPDIALGIMVRCRKKLPQKCIQVFMNKYYSPDFYSWIIPQNKEYGLISHVRPKGYLDHFQTQQMLPGGKVYAAVLPVGTCKSYADNTVLLGEAAGITKPLTGGGIVFSLATAEIAADVINDAIQVGAYDRNYLRSYERGWQMKLGKEIKKQLLARRLYRKLANKDIDDVFKTFGSHVEKFDYDYDKLSQAAKTIPKLKLLKFMISKAKLIF
ncbi:MAG: NAD(P)/FAD-dependent oxidoreductase [Candidatus Aenigmarchaeota archaeon]|nr:NAD(P)/FAD-dependent oxidoreductase [Candidatus Aenigmarchaeota archaeon]